DIARGVMLIGLPIALILMLGVRFTARMVVSGSRKPGPNSAPALVLGGGYVGMNLIQWMMSDPSSPFRPVGIIDDDPNLAKRRIRGDPVLGRMHDIGEIDDRTGAQGLDVVISIA